MLKAFAIVFFFLSSVAAPTLSAQADQTGSCVSGMYSAIACGGSLTIGLPGAANVPVTDVEAPAQQPANVIDVASLINDAAGAPCVEVTQQPDPNGQAYTGEFFNTVEALIAAYGLCPNTPMPPILDPQVLAQQFWQTIPLPVPKPSVPPGYAITGKPAYLVTGGTVAPPAYTEATPLGPLSVDAVGSYQVEWGDGTSSGPFEREGTAYPYGSIIHTYDNVGTVTVTVTEAWTATWSLGPAHGTLAQLQTRAVLPGLAVEQIQAVISQ